MNEPLSFLTAHEEHFRRSRLPALYSDFRPQQTLNPDGFVANVEAWKRGLASAARHGVLPRKGAESDMLVLSVDEDLLRALSTKEWGQPLALGTVVRNAIEKKEMMPLSNFMSATQSIYKRSWGISPWSILSWGLRQAGLTGGTSGEDKVPVAKLVILANLEEASNEVLRRMSVHGSRIDRIYSKEMFYKDYEDVLDGQQHISHADLEVLLKHLSRDKGEASYDGQTIKFKAQTDSAPPIVTQEDATIASLKTLIVDLEGQITSLSERVEKLTMTAKEAVGRKNMVAAKAALRSKKLAEGHLNKQLAVFGQLEEVYTKIEQAANQIELVRIMEGSTGVLRSFNKEVGGIERVDDVVDQLKEEMMMVDEVGGVIAEAGQGTIDEGEVDDELEALESEEREKREVIEAATEEEEKSEAAQTQRRLEALKQMEKEARAEEKLRENGESSQKEERALEESIEGFQRVSM